jgi:hypothetical protein
MQAGAAGILRSMALVVDVLFFGDNTEFRNPFREGETLLGAAATVAVELPLSDRATLVAGAFGMRQFGSDAAFDLARPVLALRLHNGRSTLTIGTLDTAMGGRPPGPDRAGPHGLLPPIQRETLSFERPYEAGLQWQFAGSSFRHDAWINWQRLNTPAHRERFDAGIGGEALVTSWLSIPFQAHIVHEGGQLFASGPVADSTAFGSGAIVRGSARSLRLTLEMHGLLSRYVPDRDAAALYREGVGTFVRTAVERAAWRGHVIAWRARNFVKVEGDSNYLGVTRAGVLHRGWRRYAEAGITRTFHPASEARVETSARLHRIEDHTEYSFRILGIVRVHRTRN